MDEEPQKVTEILQTFKPQLIDALCGDADFVLQNCHSLFLLSQREYEQVKATVVPSLQVRDILDYVMTKDAEQIQSFLKLLKKDEMQKTFPKLKFLHDLPLREAQTTGEKSRKRKGLPQEDIPQKQSCKAGSSLVSEKQLMRVARCIGTNWKEICREALELPSARLEQIAEDNPRSHRERVFSALRCWRMREREGATAARLHHLLTQEEVDVEHESIGFLLDES